ncbi:MAG: hypothetical protein OET90_08750 [Desulfuromonadales bacterium]|nr:hypothetical protein [Desulfuromonadales bacterium]
MGETELRKALQQQNAEQIEALWREAEAAIEAERQQGAASLQQLCEQDQRRLDDEIKALRSNLMFAAQTRALECRLHAEAALETRLQQLARKLLPALAETKGVWQALLRELPDIEWRDIEVAPAHEDLARKKFPAATLSVKKSLGGGLVVTGKTGTIRIDNSLEGRLLRAWPEMAPKLMLALHKEIEPERVEGL